MIEKEAKVKICNHLCEALKLTRHCDGLEHLNYFEDSGEVIAIWDSGRRSIINVKADSGMAMIRDVIRAISL